MNSKALNDLVINVDLHSAPKLSFQIKITWCVN